VSEMEDCKLLEIECCACDGQIGKNSAHITPELAKKNIITRPEYQEMLETTYGWPTPIAEILSSGGTPMETAKAVVERLEEGAPIPIMGSYG